MAPATPLTPAAPQQTSPTKLDLSTLTTRAQIQAHLASLTAHESTLDSSLSRLIQDRQRLSTQLNALDSLSEVVGGIQGEAEGMADSVRNVAETAERVGGKVRVLDEEQVGSSPTVSYSTRSSSPAFSFLTVTRQGFD